MDDREYVCKICLKEKFKYKCPKCCLEYCSVACYKSPSHLACSEAFYKTCIQEDLATSERNSEDVRKIYDILKRIHETDAGLVEDFANFNDDLDSDDEQVEDAQSDDEEDENEETLGGESTNDTLDDIVMRLQGVDLNQPDEVWERLTDAERLDFQKMVDSGDILKLVPNFKPWWRTKKNSSKIVEMESDHSEESSFPRPVILANIPDFDKIFKGTPSSCVHFNIWNTLAAYACVVRYFCGDHMSNADLAAAHLVNLSTVLKYGENFDDAEMAILSVETEALTTGNGAPNAVATGSLYVESREELQEDARQLMISAESKLSALSEIVRMFQNARKIIKNSGAGQKNLQKLFAVCNGSIELTPAKLRQFEKKIEFLLSYIKKQSERL